VHLDQQALERAELDVRKYTAMNKFHENNPKYALIYIDAMTQHTCQTPHYSKATAKGNSYKLENRIISCEVYCGYINTVFTYQTDSLVGGGANIMIEVVRQAIADLSKMLYGDLSMNFSN
jgi:hypothetical protein